MLGGSYHKIVKIWEQQRVPDGYGGSVTEETGYVFIRKVWAKVVTKGAGYKFQQFGLNDFKNPVLFSIRAKINLELTEKHFIQYKGKKFFVKGVENVNLDAIEINIYCDES